MSDTRKAPLNLVPVAALIGAARVLEHGNSRPKPGTSEPRAPGDFIERDPTEFFASLLRHVGDMQNINGITTLETLTRRDAESLLPVIDHVITNAVIIRAILTHRSLLPVDPKKPAPKPDAAAEFFRAAETYEPGPIAEPCTQENPCHMCRDAHAEREAADRALEESIPRL